MLTRTMPSVCLWVSMYIVRVLFELKTSASWQRGASHGPHKYATKMYVSGRSPKSAHTYWETRRGAQAGLKQAFE